MWSIVMEPGKIYSTVVENTFHLSMATLDLESVQKGKADDVHTVYVETDDNSRVILCHLSKESKLYQCQLDHIFPRGTDLKFVTSATANIHMTGNLYLNEDNELYSDLESKSEEEGTQIEKSVQEKGNKRKSEDNVSKKNKSIKLDESNQSDEDSVDENDSDEIMDFEEDSNEDGIKLSDLVSDDDKDEEDDDDDEDEDLPVLTIKTEELQNTPIKQLNGYDQKSPKQEQKTPLGQEKTPKCHKTPMPKTPDVNQTLINGTTKSSKNKKNKEPKTPLSGLKTEPDSPLPKDKQNQQQKLNGAVIINDLKVGDGAVAKPGKNVHNNIVQKRCTILSTQQAEETDKLLNELSIDSDCTSNDDDDDVDDDEEKDNDYVDVEDIDDDDKYKLKPDRKQNSYECSACCLKYKYKSQYLRHMMKHSKQKLFKCSFSEKCNKVFKTNQNMLRHVAQQHASIERYECSKCNSVYRHKSSLTSHMQDKHSHRNIQHVCNVCQKSFSKFKILKYHLNDHSGEKPYKCEFCDERFSEPSKKCRHVKKMHRA